MHSTATKEIEKMRRKKNADETEKVCLALGKLTTDDRNGISSSRSVFYSVTTMLFVGNERTNERTNGRARTHRHSDEDRKLSVVL